MLRPSKVNFGQLDRLRELLVNAEVAKHKDPSCLGSSGLKLCFTRIYLEVQGSYNQAMTSYKRLVEDSLLCRVVGEGLQNPEITFRAVDVGMHGVLD